MSSLSKVFRFTESNSHSCDLVSESLSNIRLLYHVGMSLELKSVLVTSVCTFIGGIVGTISRIISVVDVASAIVLINMKNKF